MATFTENLKEKILEINSRLELRQKLILGALSLVTISVFIMLVTWSTRTEYSYLIGDLDTKQAAAVRDKLTEMGVDFEMVEGGKAFKVPQEKVYDVRLSLAAEEVGIDNETGFEIFDKTSLGMTEKIQDINWIRALQGELQRTIVSINGVDEARVHLVIPEEKIFKEDEKPVTASVWLRLKKNKLSKKKIEGMVNLIAGAIEGLDTENVTIVDQEGNTLTEERDETFSGIALKRHKIRNEFEKTIANKIRNMLDNIYGSGNSDVQVSAELNFDNIETTSENFDPSSQVARTEEIQTSNTEDEADSLSKNTEHLIQNYEINKTVQHIIKQVGNVSRLSVAVNINHKLDIRQEEGEIIKEYQPRTANEIAQIEQSVKNAMGFDDKRGDTVVVNSVQFDTTQYEFEEKIRLAEEKKKDFAKQIEKGVILLILVVMVFVLYKQFKKAFITPEEEEEKIRQALAEGEIDSEGFYPEGEEGMPMGEGKISYTFKPMKDIEIEQTAAQQLQDSVRNFVNENPELAVRLIKSWLLESRGV